MPTPALPAAYAWLTALKPLPRTIAEALGLLGTLEVPGAGSNPTIMGWRDELGAAGIVVAGYTDDTMPWCGLFAAIVALRAGKPVPAGPLWARNWAKFGARCARPALGDVLVFERPGGGGHVGFYVAEDDAAYHVLGGNQGDAVSIVRIAKARCIAVRRPPYQAPPASMRPHLVARGGALSTNEA